MMARRRVAAYAVAVVLCLILGGCASDPAPPAVITAPSKPLAEALPAEPELAAPVPEAEAPQAAPKPSHKVHKPRKASRQREHEVAKADQPAPSFKCHIVREAAIEGPPPLPLGTEPARVDLYARIDSQARTLAVERASDPAFAQTGEHCGDGKPSPASVRKKTKRRKRR